MRFLPAFVGFILLILMCSNAFAEKIRVVILDVPGGGTELIVNGVKEIPTESEIKDQAWFLKFIKKRGFKAKKILSRKRDLGRIMKAGKIDYIIATVPQDENFEVRLIDKEAEPQKTLSVPKTDDELSTDGAEKIVSAFATVLGYGAEEEESTEEEKESEEVAEETEESEESEESEEEAELAEVTDGEKDVEASANTGTGLQNFLWIELKPAFLKHDMSFAGANGALLTYNSAFYPGVQLESEIYVGALVPDADASSAGIYLGAIGGADKIIFGDDSVTLEEPLLHLEIEAGLLYRVDSPLRNRSTTNIRARFRVSARHIRYQVDSPALPQTTLTTINVVGKIAYPLFFDNFAIEGMVNFTPFGFFGESAELFGNSSIIYGFGTQLGVVYGLGDNFGLTAGYGFRLLRAQFKGDGVSDFDNTQAFDLVQGLQAGIAIQF